MKTILEIQKEQQEKASLLKAAHEEHASLLIQSQQEDATTLKKSQENVFVDSLAGHSTNNESIHQHHGHTRAILAESQKKAATILEDSQLKAATALKEVQEIAATFLEETHVKSAKRHEEKDDIISWLQGGYSVKQSS